MFDFPFEDKEGAFDVNRDTSIAARLRSLSATLAYCSDSVRYDIQRNLVRSVEELARTKPLSLVLFRSMEDVAETFISSYGEGRGKVHIGLRRIAQGQTSAGANGANVEDLSSLRSVFAQNAKADKFMLDRMLAARETDGSLVLSEWGKFVLRYMDKQLALENAARTADITPKGIA